MNRTDRIGQLNTSYSAKHGEDLFKATNKTSQALVRISKPLSDGQKYQTFIDDLYFLFRESLGNRIGEHLPDSFRHVNDLRTDLRHDVDHGEASKIRSKRKKLGQTFSLYAAAGTPGTIDPAKLPLFQANLLGAIEGGLRALQLRPL